MIVMVVFSSYSLNKFRHHHLNMKNTATNTDDQYGQIGNAVSWKNRLRIRDRKENGLQWAVVWLFEQREAGTNGHQGHWSSTTNVYLIWCDQLFCCFSGGDTLEHTHTCSKHIICSHTLVRLHKMDTLFMALSALVCFFSVWLEAEFASL